MSKRERTATFRRSRAGSTARPVFLIVLVAIAQSVFFTSAIFRLHTIDVTGTYRLQRSEVLSAAHLSPDALLYRIPLPQVEQRVKKLHWVQEVAVRRSLPGRVSIRVSERNPVLAVRSLDEPSPFPAGWFVASADGMILAPAEASSHQQLPRCCVPGELAVGTLLQPSLIDNILRVRKALPPELEARVLELRADPDDQLELVYQLMGRPTVVRLGSADHIARKFTVLGAMLDRLALDHRPVTYIDLRYNEPAAGRPALVSAKGAKKAAPHAAAASMKCLSPTAAATTPKARKSAGATAYRPSIASSATPWAIEIDQIQSVVAGINPSPRSPGQSLC